MVKRHRQDDGYEGSRKKASHSRIGRACDRCQHRKLACDPTDHGCQPCQKAKTWCTVTDNLSGTPAYRGQYEFLERRVEQQYREIQDLVHELKSLGQDVSGRDLKDNETIRYMAWKKARSIEPGRPWEKEDEQANYTKDLVLHDGPESSPRTQYSKSLNGNSPSPLLTPSGDFDLLAQPYRQHRSSSIYSAPPQLPSSSHAPIIPATRLEHRRDNMMSHDRSFSTRFIEGHQRSIDNQGLFVTSRAAPSSKTFAGTLESLHLLSSHADGSLGPVYAPDGSLWYSFINGSDGLQNYAPTTSMMLQDTNNYALPASAGYRAGMFGHQELPIVVIDSLLTI